MEQDIALQLIDAVKSLADRIDRLEASPRRHGRTGAQAGKYCRWTRKDGAFYVSIEGKKINGSYDHEKTAASKLGSVEECEKVMAIVDNAVEFAIAAVKQ